MRVCVPQKNSCKHPRQLTTLDVPPVVTVAEAGDLGTAPPLLQLAVAAVVPLTTPGGAGKEGVSPGKHPAPPLFPLWLPWGGGFKHFSEGILGFGVPAHLEAHQLRREWWVTPLPVRAILRPPSAPQAAVAPVGRIIWDGRLAGDLGDHAVKLHQASMDHSQL